MKNGLSVIIITRNEEIDIEDCLKSVSGFASEIVVVDSGSTDKTLDIVRRYTSRVYHKEFTGYSAQKQYALEQAKGPWILNIDADERVSAELADEIKLLLSGEPSCHGYDIPYRHTFLGKRLRFGGLRGETHLRLFEKENSRYETNPIHEGISVPPPLGRCHGHIDHISYRDIQEYLKKCNEYTSTIAEQKFNKGQRFRLWHHARLPMEFFYRYVLKLGFLDGGPGFVYALLSSYYVWLKFLKLNDLQRRNYLK